MEEQEWKLQIKRGKKELKEEDKVGVTQACDIAIWVRGNWMAPSLGRRSKTIRITDVSCNMDFKSHYCRCDKALIFSNGWYSLHKSEH